MDHATLFSETVTTASGRIRGFNQCGTILVETNRFDHPIPCYCLRSSSAPLPVFKINELVACIFSDNDREGYIIGCIEPYFPDSDSEVAQSEFRNMGC